MQFFFNAIYSHQTPSNKDKRNVTLSEIKALNDRLNTARRKVFEELIDPVDFKLMKADCEQEINELERKLVATQSNNPKSIDAMLDCDYYLPDRCEFQKKNGTNRKNFNLCRFAVRTGLEPATPCVTGMYSNQLNYRTKISTFKLHLMKLRFPSFLRAVVVNVVQNYSEQ